MTYNFKRPSILAFPQVYYKFKANDNNSNNVVDYIVQDLPEEIIDDAIKMLIEDYLSGEPFALALNLLDKPRAIKHYAEFWRGIINEKLSIACSKNDGSSELVGVNLLVVNSKDDVTAGSVFEVSTQAEIKLQEFTIS